jgi:hypothetical protein
MERCRDLLIRAIEDRDATRRDRLSRMLEALLHLDGEVRRHAEPRFLVEATLVRLAVESDPAEGLPSPVGAVLEPSAPAPGPTRADVPAPAPAPLVERLPATPPAAVVESAPAMPLAEPSLQDPAVAVEPAGSPADLAAGWRRLLERLSPKTRGYFIDARAEVEGDRLLLTFRYGFHYKMAQESAAQVEPLVKAWLGQDAGLDLRLQEPGSGTAAAAPTPRPLAPEEDPLIKAAERKLEGRVVRVRPLKELE